MSSPDSSGVTESIANLSITATDAPQERVEETEEQTTPRQSQFPAVPQQPEASSKRKRGESDEDLSHSGSDTEKETAVTTSKMPSGSSSKHHSSSSSSSSKKHHSSSSSAKQHTKSDDWSDVTEPEERRRIQNRIAQRKFREKTREQKERQEREARNQELAGSSYAVPLASDLSGEGAADDASYGAGGDYLSGLPWGGLNIPHMVARGHESVSQQGSRRGASDHHQQQQQQSQQQQQQQQQNYYDPQLWGGDMGYGGGAGAYDAADDRGWDEPVDEEGDEQDAHAGKGKGTGKDTA